MAGAGPVYEEIPGGGVQPGIYGGDSSAYDGVADVAGTATAAGGAADDALYTEPTPQTPFRNADGVIYSTNADASSADNSHV